MMKSVSGDVFRIVSGGKPKSFVEYGEVLHNILGTSLKTTEQGAYILQVVLINVSLRARLWTIGDFLTLVGILDGTEKI